ncbi:MAG: sulfotransferase family 2 domain-containing protein [Mesorhizobium sp.]
MAIEIKDLAITYYPIPKSGSSSIKYALLALDGKEGSLSDPDNDVHGHLTTNYVDPLLPVYDGHKRKFTIVRDPLLRLLSAYSSRITDTQVLTGPSTNIEMLRSFGLPVDPDLDTFILNIEKYCACSWEVRFHVASPRYFTGSSLFLFERVFKFEQIDQVAAFLSSASGRTFVIPQLQASGRRCSPSDLLPAALAKAMRFCRYDYGFLVDYYDPQRWGGIPEGDPGDPSTLHVFGDPAVLRNGQIVYPRTPRNLMNFMSKRALKERRKVFL